MRLKMLMTCAHLPRATEAEFMPDRMAGPQGIVAHQPERQTSQEKEDVMVTKCANPSCGASFQYLRLGKLFLVDLPSLSPPGRRSEYFWLCGRCCPELTVIVDASGQAAVAKARASGQA
jgi:hypothetical protein